VPWRTGWYFDASFFDPARIGSIQARLVAITGRTEFVGWRGTENGHTIRKGTAGLQTFHGPSQVNNAPGEA